MRLATFWVGLALIAAALYPFSPLWLLLPGLTAVAVGLLLGDDD